MKLKIKSTITICVISIALSQNVESVPKEDLFNSIQFGITDKFTLGTFEGSLISYKRHLSARDAIRIGFSATIDNRRTASKSYYPTRDIYDNTEDRKLKYIRHEISIQYLRFSRFNNKLRFYFGIGPIVIKSENLIKSNRAFYYYEPDTIRYQKGESKIISKGFGLMGTFGFEWSLNNNLCFIAEYGASYIKGKSKYSYEYNYPLSNDTRLDLSKENYKKLEPREINFGLSFYF